MRSMNLKTRKANVTQFYATGFCTLEPPMPCVQDCELILMRSGSDKADKRYGILTQHVASLQPASYFVISNRFLPLSFDLRSSNSMDESVNCHTMLAHHISFALSELQPAMSSYLPIFPTQSLPLNGRGSQDAS